MAGTCPHPMPWPSQRAQRGQCRQDPSVPLLTVGLEDLAVDDVGQGLQLLLQQALGRQVPNEVPQQGPAVQARGFNKC